MGGDENRPGQGSSKERHAQRAREPDEGGGQPGVTWSAAATSAKGVSRLGADPGEEGRLGRCFPDLHSPEHQGLLGKSLALTLPYCPEPTQLIKVCLPDKHIHTHTHTHTTHTCVPASSSSGLCCLPSLCPPPSQHHRLPAVFTHSPQGHQGLSQEKPGSRLPQVLPFLWPSPALLRLPGLC